MPLEHRSHRVDLLFSFLAMAFALPLCIITYVLSRLVDLLFVICWTLINLSNLSSSPPHFILLSVFLLFDDLLAWKDTGAIGDISNLSVPIGRVFK